MGALDGVQIAEYECEMRDGYLYALVWSNFMTGQVRHQADQTAPELLSAWPTRSFGGQEVLIYRLTDRASLLLVRPNGDSMPSCFTQVPQQLPHPGCPIDNPMDVFGVIRWARRAFELRDRDSAFVVPVGEAPQSQEELDAIPADVRRALDAQIVYEFRRISAVLRGYAEVAAPPRTTIHAGTISVQGDLVVGNKVVHERIPVARLRVHIDEIDSFEKVREISAAEAKKMLANGRFERAEDEVQGLLETVLAVPVHRKDWGGETNDLYSANLSIGGARVPTAFLLKGSGLRARTMEISHCGKNGDQLLRLCRSPAELFVVQFVGEISDSVIADIHGKVRERQQGGEPARYCIIDGQETARLFIAYAAR